MKSLAVKVGVSTIYLLPCTNGYLQIDTAYSHDYGLYRRRLARLGIDIDEVRFLFLTHHHDDHAGFLNDLARDTPVRIIAHAGSPALLEGGKNDLSRGGGYVNSVVKTLAGLKMRFDPHWTLTFPPFRMREDDILVEGDDNNVLRELGVNGSILYTPGHCIDHLSIVLDTGDAFCGDAASSFLLWAGTHYCTVFMTDMGSAYHSWDKLIQAGTRTIYPSHGRPFPVRRLMENRDRITTDALVRFF